MNIRKVLVTGGAGYIGTHCCVELLKNGFEVVCADNFANSNIKALDRVREITGMPVRSRDVDMCDPTQVKTLFREDFDAAIHFAGHKAVGESIEHPLMYYRNNLLSLINLCEALKECNCKNMVFSSSAAVYSSKNAPPYNEGHSLEPTNPYGRTKVMIETMLRDLHASDPEWNIAILRYFNPVGAHPSGLIGENPTGAPNNLMPYIAQVAIGKRKQLSIFGKDYATPDGTCIRDFIHVVDLARGHLSALRKLEEAPGCMTHNIGTGQGHSVLEIVEAFERVNNVKVPYTFAPRRAGDTPVNFADTDKARRELGWEAKLDLDAMCRDTWNWQSKNPRGYDD
ncbi:UDP-glucose 4-epimerase GalE [Pseudodesulfovibrio sp.]|uniref:UDP-glucose 4-epimerase GalE n=1 Tax=unclassified Pseudodesulfovibrio TaxID=2661612 RepID=UPI003B00DAE8